MTITSRTVFSLAVLCLWATTGWSASWQWHDEPGSRWADLPAHAQHAPGFTLLAPDQTGLNFTNTVDEMASASNRILLNGAGLATGDFDNDGLADLYLCSLSGGSKLYRNLGGMRFQDVTEVAGVGLPGVVARGAVFADINGDRALDLLVSTLGQGVICFLNDGRGHFSNATRAADTSSTYGSVTMALADVDGNGTLDLYISNYRTEDIRDRGQVDLLMVKGQLTVPPKLRDRLAVVNGQVLEFGEPDQLLLNDGQGHFTPVSWTGGAFLDEEGKPLKAPPLDWGLTAAFHDLNGDGYPDLYVCNDYWTPDRVWINDGHGHFRAIAHMAMRETSSSSMGIDFADLDGDGYLDFIVTDMLSRDPRMRKRQMPARWAIPEPIQAIEFRPQIIQNTLFHDRGDGTYEEIANYAHVAASEWTWQPLFMDVDLDGYPDLLVSAGHARDVQDMDAERQIQSRQHSWKGWTNAVQRQQAFSRELMEHMRYYPRLDMPIFAFRNTGQLQFQEVTTNWGTALPGVHHSMAVADLDNDGDLDLVVNNLRSVVGLYRNEADGPRVAVRVKGSAPNTQGIGAQVVLVNGAIPRQQQEVISGGRYMAGADPLLVFAAAPQTNMALTVHWRSGRTSEVQGVRPNCIYELEEPLQPSPTQPLPVPTQTLFEDRSVAIQHIHHEDPYDDLARQQLLSKRLSQLGPGVAWFDVDGDGWDDLIIGSGRGGRLQVFINDRRGGFNAMNEAPFNLPVTRDQTSVLGLVLSDGHRRILAGSSNYEDGLATGTSVRQYDPAGKIIDESIPGQLSSTGPLALADLEGDGQLELFVGGRGLPGRYPEAASSLILRQTNGRWEIDSANTRPLRNAGLVSGAVWSDLDGDGLPELLLACEWGPVKVFKNVHGQLQDATAELGLDRWTGWWSGINTIDIDGDGRPDIVAGNWGLNSSYVATPEQPLRCYYGDLAHRGIVDILEAEWDPIARQEVPRRRLDALAPALPFLLGQFATHRAFSEAALATMLEPVRSDIRSVEARSLASMVFLNWGGRFEPVELPREAQLAPVFAVQVADFDGDGKEDLFLSQNFFDVAAELPRQDAGRGLLLLGNGTGRLQAVPGQQSGIRVYGQQRGAAVADFNKDGRVDLVVTQNSAETRLFRNVTAKPGLRIRLVGPPGNPSAVGASMRLLFGRRMGPLREVHAGSGYWSQDSSIQVLGTPESASALWVRWPGGKVTTTSLPQGAHEVVVNQEGKISDRN